MRRLNEADDKQPLRLAQEPIVYFVRLARAVPARDDAPPTGRGAGGVDFMPDAALNTSDIGR